MKRIAIVAALPGELKPLVAGWPHARRGAVDLWRLSLDGFECVACCGGAGAPAVGRALAQLEPQGRWDLVVSAGWAGALRPEFATGRAWAIGGVIDRGSGERFPTILNGSGAPWLVTSHQVADPAEKREISATYGAGLVDMEAVEVARWALAHSVRFAAIKGVSDGPTDRLPDFNAFFTKEGQFQMGRFVGFALLRPHLWSGLIRMGRNSSRAAKALGKSLGELLTQERKRLL